MSRCPECNASHTRCISSFEGHGGERVRRRVCRVCAHRYYSFTPPEVALKSWQLRWERNGPGKPTFTVRTTA